MPITGRATSLHGASFQVRAGITSLLGRNGSGRSTTLKAIMGLVRPTRGTVTFSGTPINGLDTFRIARFGIAYVPEAREIFSNLTVEENLRGWHAGSESKRSGLDGRGNVRLLSPTVRATPDRCGTPFRRRAADAHDVPITPRLP